MTGQRKFLQILLEGPIGYVRGRLASSEFNNEASRKGRYPMFAQHSRSALLAGLLTAALFGPAWSADGDAAKPEPAGTQQPVAMAASPPPQSGPVVARESLATEASARAAVVVEGESQPTRSYDNLSIGKRYAGKRNRIAPGTGVAYSRPVYRHSLMLGIGY
jgi:hypothetical protein